MIRTQVYFTEDLYAELINKARSTGSPVAKVIRETLKLGLASDRTHGNDLMKLAHMKIKGGPKNLSARLDKFLYGS